MNNLRSFVKNSLQSDRSRYAPQSDEIVGSLKQFRDEMIIDLTALEEEGAGSSPC